MIPIDRTEIETWGQKFDAKSNFPKLIAKLIMETTPKSTFFQVPSGSAVFIEGWDGVVECKEETNFVPEGISLWEIGANGTKTKANTDYEKRTDKSLGFDKSNATFIFITSNIWKNKQHWIDEKTKDGIWKDIRVYDSRDISEWLENSPISCRWFSILSSTHPYDGIYIAEEYWKMLSFGPKGQLPPKAITSGREIESQQILKFLSGDPALLAVRGFTKEEAIAFIIASVMQSDERSKELFLSRSVIVDTLPNFHGIRINKNSLNIIAKLDDTGTLYVAIANQHHVLVPLGPDDSFASQDVIILPRIDGNGQIEALTEMGFKKEEARKYSKEAGRDYTILKNLLEFPPDRTKWKYQDKVKEIIPALLIGRWDKSKEGDREIIEKLSGEKYEIYSERLNKWLEVEAPPLIKIGDTWRLTSPLDAWTNLSSKMTISDFENLKKCFLTVLGEIDPIFDLSTTERSMASIRGKESNYSKWCREGLTQSMILVGLYSDKLKIHDNHISQEWVDKIIEELLFNATGKLWASLDSVMPLIAEASPHSFLDAVEHSLSLEEMPIMKIFEEEESWLTPTSRHTGLLWALEGLAWSPEYLFQASLTLAKLSSLDPGGKLSNRPINSLNEIFKPWHFQTFASIDERMKILEQIVENEFEIGWTLLINMLPNGSEVAHPTHKMRWRLFDESFDLKYTWNEIWNTHSKLILLLIKYFDNSESKLSDLLKISKSNQLNPRDRSTILTFIEDSLSKINIIDNLVWDTIRNILSRHRSYPDAKWSLTESELKKYERLYKKLEPADTADKISWMFNDYWPKFPEGIEKKEISAEAQDKIALDKRIEALKNIYDRHGFDDVKSLVWKVKEPWIVGDTLAHIIKNDQEVLKLCEFLKKDDKTLPFIQRFLFRKSLIEGLDWVFDIYRNLKEREFNNKQLAIIFTELEQTTKVWKFVENTNQEIINEYWTKLHPRFWNLPINEKIYGIHNLIQVNRFISALDICSHNPEDIPSDMLVEILEKAATQKSNEQIPFDSYKAERIIESLEERDDVDREELIKLEWLYLPFLASYGSSYKPYVLHKELSNNPDFFIEVLSLAYKSDEENEDSEVSLDEHEQNRARNAFDLINSWKQIPGMEKTGKIDEDYLWNWVKRARELANKVGRLKVTDVHIGQVLAEYPENVEPWPPEEICSIIDKINTKSLKSGFASSTFNKRGSSTRGPFDGGDIERKHAEYFHTQSKKIKNKYPKTAKVLSQLASGYEKDAKRMDEMAERDKLDYM